MDFAIVSPMIVAVTGAGAAYASYRLGKRGQKNDEKQQEAANRLQKRITAFDELESLNARLTEENTRLIAEVARLRPLENEAEARGDMRLARQASRCREQLEQVTTALATLQSVVVSEIANASAQHAIDLAEQHIAADHPDEQPDLG